MLEAGIQQLVVANASVSALIGTRFYPVLVPEDATYPCASYQVISDVPENLLAGSPAGLSTIRLQIDTWSGGTLNATYAAAKAVQHAIRLLLAGSPKTATAAAVPCFSGALPGGTIVAGIWVLNAVDGFEQDARSYRTSTDYKIVFYPGT